MQSVANEKSRVAEGLTREWKTREGNGNRIVAAILQWSQANAKPAFTGGIRMMNSPREARTECCRETEVLSGSGESGIDYP
jgi:hypothetical protein